MRIGDREPGAHLRGSHHSSDPDRVERRSAWPVGLAGLAFGVLLALRVLVVNGMDPTIFVAFGEDAPIQTAYGRELLGDVTLRHGFGHDGKFFFAQANDPWYLEPERNAVILDRPIYRAQRMLYPLVAGGFGLFPPGAVVWAMLITNVLSLGAGAYVAARLATAWGASRWIGVWVPLNVGLLFELDIGGSGILAYLCCLAALLALVSDRPWLASALFASAALARETMILFAVGVFALWWLERHHALWRILAVPVLSMVVWDTYLWIRLIGIPGAPLQAATITSPPFTGLIEAFRYWLGAPLDLLFSGVMLAVIVVFVPLAIRSHLSIAWGAIPFAGLVLVLSVYVLREPFDLARAVAPIFTAFAFVASIRDRRSLFWWVARIRSRAPAPSAEKAET